MVPVSSRHAAVISKIGRWLAGQLADCALVSVRLPVRLDDFSEPEPDVALLRLSDDDYADAHPGPREVFLLIEVAQSSLLLDREVKIPQYARAGIAEVWWFNLEQQHVECFSEPGPRGYATVTVHRRGAMLAPRGFPQGEGGRFAGVNFGW
jgi:Uma2 family endonuclease